MLQELRSRALVARRASVAQALGSAPRPCLVMLNLAKQAGDTPQLLPALVLSEVGCCRGRTGARRAEPCRALGPNLAPMDCVNGLYGV